MQERASRLRACAVRMLGSTWFLGAVVALLSWPARDVAPALGPDPSWMTALHYAAEHRLEFGTQVIFTYGPLGFLKVPLVAYDVPAVLSALYVGFVQLALGLTLVWAARRSFPLVVALVVALVAASLMSQLFIPTEAIIPVVFIWCVVALADDAPPFSRPLLVMGGAAVGAIEVLAKLNTGLLVLALCTVAVLALQRERPRSLPVFALTFLASLATLWFALGQGVGNVDDYVSTAFETISGYSRAKTIDAPAVGWDRPAAAVLIAAALAATYTGTRDVSPVRRAAALLLALLLSFALLKQAFVFHNARYVALFVAAMLAPWLAVRWRGESRWVAVGAIAAISVVYFPLSQGRVFPGLTDTIRPIHRTGLAVDQLRALLVPGARDETREQARARLESVYRLDSRSLALLDGEPVAIYASEFSLAWTYDLDWRPLPVLGSYQTYTQALDERNADALASNAGPARILRHRVLASVYGVELKPSQLLPSTFGFENRYAPYEGPETTLAMLCNFEPLRTTRRYQVLVRVRDRCGQPRPVSSRRTQYGRPVRVPRPPGRNEIVLASVEGLAPSGIELLRTLLYRSSFRYVVFDGRYRHRVFPDTHDDLMLTAPERIDFSRPFALAPNATAIEFERDPGLAVSGDELTINFFALRVRPAPRDTQGGAVPDAGSPEREPRSPQLIAP